MILVADIGNTNMEIGFFDGDRFVTSERLSTNHEKTDMEFAMDISFILQLSGIDSEQIDGAIVSSVVPPVNHRFQSAVKKAVGRKPLLVEPGIKTGLKIKIDDPAQLGADMDVASVGAIEKYGSPLIIIDMGTATTYSYIDSTEAFCGAAIMPGVNTSLESLIAHASLLPKIDFVAPKHVIMKNTIGSMQSGLIYGEAARIDGMIKKIREDVRTDARVIATGGLAPVILPHVDSEVTLDNELVMEGLRVIYERNMK